MIRRTILFLLIIISEPVSASDSLFIKVHFLYGSVPKKEFKDVERKRFGGIHGGHVMIEFGDYHYGFNPSVKLHIFGKKKDFHSCFRAHKVATWAKDTAGNKYTSFIIPVTSEQMEFLQDIHQKYLNSPPYDYAFFGMRCASASYEILAQAGLMKPFGRHRTAIRFFYPKLLRKKLIKISEKRGYERVSHPGSERRRWEKDSFL